MIGVNRSLQRHMRGLLALLLMLSLVVGVPAVLLRVAALDPTRLTEMMSHPLRPIDGRTLTSVLGVVAWASWAVMAAAIGAEFVGLLVRVRPPRLAIFAAPQSLAGSLIASIALLASATPPPVGASPAAVSHRAHPTTDVAPPLASASSAAHSTPVVALASSPARQVVVERHDTLWHLAHVHLGHGSRYREIFELNENVVQPDGGRLTDARLIYPGWVLVLPPPPVRHLPPGPAPVDWGVDRGELRSESGHHVSSHLSASTPRLRTDLTDVEADAVHRPTVLDEDDGRGIVAPIGLTGLTLGLVVAEIDRQRRARQRTRRPGQRLRPPSVGEQAVETRVRAFATPDAGDVVRGSLLQLAARCRDEGRSLPDVAWIRVDPSGVELRVIGAAADAIPPFVSVSEQIWRCERSDVRFPDSPQAHPYPSLLSVGTSGDGILLINLDSAGRLVVASEHDRADEILAAAALDLGVHPEAERPHLRVFGDQMDTAETRMIEKEIGYARSDVSALLESRQAPDLLAARSADPEDLWESLVVVGKEISAPAEPWTGVALVTTSGTSREGLITEGVELVERGGWTLEPDHVAVEPAVVDPVTGAALSDLLRPQVLAGIDGEEIAQVRAALADTGPRRPWVDGAPRVLVLGPVTVSGVDDQIITGRVNRARELAAYLVLHPTASRADLDEALWPGRRVERTTRNSFVSRARQWLGRDSTGAPYLPIVATDGRYYLHHDVGSDWSRFVELAGTALQGLSPDVELLDEALALVRGRPFRGVDPMAYPWADSLAQDMISAIVDVAHVASVQHLRRGDRAAASAAALRGLQVDRCSEMLYRDLISTAMDVGDRDGVDRAIRRMRSCLDEIDPDGDLDPLTIDLLDRATRVVHLSSGALAHT